MKLYMILRPFTLSPPLHISPRNFKSIIFVFFSTSFTLIHYRSQMCLFIHAISTPLWTSNQITIRICHFWQNIHQKWSFFCCSIIPNRILSPSGSIIYLLPNVWSDFEEEKERISIRREIEFEYHPLKQIVFFTLPSTRMIGSSRVTYYTKRWKHLAIFWNFFEIVI